ncbi:MAG: 3-hydroxybutyryl-CoA dehydrogenase [Pseudomonadota bacterium]
MTREIIAVVGAGRMGRGIAIAFSFAGHQVRLVDAKPRDQQGFQTLRAAALGEVRATLIMLSELGMCPADAVDTIAARVSLSTEAEMSAALAGADVVFEAVPETLVAKEAVFARISALADPKAIIASTTSTILSDTLQDFVEPPQRFLNAHWLNPAFLVPLVELSPGAATAPDATATLKAVLERIGKVPVLCKASPGYIVPRIQALAMNEAARMVEEGVATPEDIDKATTYGFGFRFAVLGLLEFVDWGGGDILYHASRYMAEATGERRFAPPAIVADNMAQNRRGLRDGEGFFDHRGRDVAAYQKARLAAFVGLLAHMGHLPPRG